MNGQLMPGLLAPVYNGMSPIWRLMILVPIAAIPANWLVATGYRVAGPGLGGTVYVVTAVLAMVTVAMLVEGARLNWQIAAGTLMMAASGALVVRGLTP